MDVLHTHGAVGELKRNNSNVLKMLSQENDLCLYLKDLHPTEYGWKSMKSEVIRYSGQRRTCDFAMKSGPLTSICETLGRNSR